MSDVVSPEEIDSILEDFEKSKLNEDRCRGHCCRCFALSLPYQEIEKSVRGEFKNSEGVASTIQDDRQLLEMLVSLGPMTNQEVFERFGISGFGNDPVNICERFTCKHLQENGDCGIYESRPEMCSSYPKSENCQYQQCESACFKNREQQNDA